MQDSNDHEDQAITDSWSAQLQEMHEFYRAMTLDGQLGWVHGPECLARQIS